MQGARFATFGPLEQLHREMTRVFDNLPAIPMPGAPRPLFPAVNIWESAEAVTIQAELPGIDASTLEVVTLNDELTLKGQRQPVAPEGGTLLRAERGAGAFTRTIGLPCKVDADRVEATLRDGVLTVHMPKAAEARPRQIRVNG